MPNGYRGFVSLERALLPPRWMQAFAMLAALALFVRALVPPGYMPAQGQTGRFLALTVCSGQGAGEVFLDLSTGALVEKAHVPPGERPHADGPCLFSGVAPLAPPLAVAQAPAPVLREWVVWRSSSAQHGLPPLRGPPKPWPTGPPRIA